MKCIFHMQINIEIINKLIPSFWVCATRHAQSKKFAYLCDISRKARGRGEVISCLQISAKVDNIILGLFSQACPKYPSISISRKTWMINLIFCLQINIKGFFKLLLSFYVCVARHPQITQNNKFALSLQYLKKELSDEVDLLHAGEHENLLRIDCMILIEMVKHPQSSLNSKFVLSLQYL